MGLFGNKLDRVAKNGTWSEVFQLANNYLDDGDYDTYAFLITEYAKRAYRDHYPASDSLSSAYYSAGEVYEHYARAGDRSFFESAYVMYYRAATMGSYSDEDAMYRIGLFYENGYISGGMNLAIKWYKEARYNGSQQARDALYRLGY